MFCTDILYFSVFKYIFLVFVTALNQFLKMLNMTIFSNKRKQGPKTFLFVLCSFLRDFKAQEQPEQELSVFFMTFLLKESCDGQIKCFDMCNGTKGCKSMGAQWWKRKERKKMLFFNLSWFPILNFKNLSLIIKNASNDGRRTTRIPENYYACKGSPKTSACTPYKYKRIVEIITGYVIGAEIGAPKHTR